MCGRQRARTALVPVAVEPRFNDSFLINLQPPGATSMASLRELLRRPNPIHMVLCRVQRKQDRAGAGSDESKGVEGGTGVAAAALTNELEAELVATCELDWRRALGRCAA